MKWFGALLTAISDLWALVVEGIRSQKARADTSAAQAAAEQSTREAEHAAAVETAYEGDYHASNE